MPNPIILIHGIKDTAAKMEPMARYLRSRGREVHSVTLTPSWGQVGLEVLAEQLKSFIDARVDASQPIDIVAFSMGGLVARYYIQRLGGLSRVKHFVTLATPHRGTYLAYVLSNVAGRQMRPGSDFLRALDADTSSLGQIRCVSIYTPFDLIIIPATNSRISFGKNIRVWQLVHPGLVWSLRCIRLVSELMNT